MFPHSREGKKTHYGQIVSSKCVERRWKEKRACQDALEKQTSSSLIASISVLDDFPKTTFKKKAREKSCEWRSTFSLHQPIRLIPIFPAWPIRLEGKQVQSPLSGAFMWPEKLECHFADEFFTRKFETKVIGHKSRISDGATLWVSLHHSLIWLSLGRMPWVPYTCD